MQKSFQAKIGISFSGNYGNFCYVNHLISFYKNLNKNLKKENCNNRFISHVKAPNIIRSCVRKICVKQSPHVCF